MNKTKLLKSILIPTLGISTIGSIAAVSTSCSCGSKEPDVIHVTDVRLNKPSTTLAVGDTETLTATVLPETATDKSVNWTSSDTNVATVNSNGTITAISSGTATITVKTNDGGKTATCEVNVEDPTSSPYVVITANEDSSLTLKNQVGNNPNLQYSTDRNNWTKYSTKIDINQGQSLYLKGNNPNGWSHDLSTYSTLSITGDVSISGNVMGLLDNGAKSGEQGDITGIPCDYCFRNLFQNCTGIASVSDSFLPATTLAYMCYTNMFSGCTALITVPDLPATNLANWCYGSMFAGCSSLTTTPALHATTLADSCYAGMFSGCTALITVPDLPATTLTNDCYRGMFWHCSSLTTVPDLPATTLASSCYNFMFQGCTSLNSIKIGYTGNYDYAYFNDWVKEVADSGTFYYNGSQTPQDFQLPSGWTKSPF